VVSVTDPYGRILDFLDRVIVMTLLLFLFHATPLYPQTLSLTSPTSGGRSVGIVRLRTEATELVIITVMSRNSVVGIATGYGLDDRGDGVRVPLGSRIITSPCCPDRLRGPPNLLSNGYRVKWQQRREAGHSPPISAEVKKMWIIYPLPHTSSWRSA
jgi:hypothetical protein